MVKRVGLLLAAALAIVAVTAACSPDTPEAPSDATRETPSPTANPTATAIRGVAVSAEQVWVAVSPRIVQPGAKIDVSGHGFAPGESLSVTLLDESGQIGSSLLTATADLRGALPVTPASLPAALGSSQYTVSLQGSDSGRSAAMPLWVRASAPALELDRDTVHPEEALTVRATGFAPRERVVVYLAGRGAEPIAALDADNQGNLTTNDARAPIIEPGDQQLVATGSVSLAQATHALRILPFEPMVFLNANNLPPGEAVGFFGLGFAARDQIEIMLDGSVEDRVSVSTDARGFLQAPQAFKLPPNAKGGQTFVISAPKTGQTIRLQFQAVPSYPYVELDRYSGRAGDQLTLTARFLRPRERLDVLTSHGGQRKKLASFRADDNGWLPADARFTLPAELGAGTMVLALEGEASRPPIRVNFVVRQ